MITFSQFLEASNKFRLNPEDYQQLPSNGINSKFSGDMHRAAMQNTIQSVENALPEITKKGIERTRELLLASSRFHEFACDRCGGEGVRPDMPGWTPHGKLGKICYRCNGEKIDPTNDPIFFRRRVIDNIQKQLKNGDVRKVVDWAHKVEESTEEQQPYKPAIYDIAQLILMGKPYWVNKLIH